MINEIPESLINCEVFEDGDRLLGIATVDLPEFEQVTAEISGAGIAGKSNVPIAGHFEPLEVTLHWRTIYQTPLKLMKSDASELSIRGAMQHYEASSGKLRVVPVRVDIRERHTSTGLGKFEPGNPTETETKLACDYIKIVVDAFTVVEFDLYNYVYKVNDNDLMSVVRLALGLL